MASTETHSDTAAHPEAHDHGGQSLNRLAVSATVHCMTGCVIGEVTGLVIATALGWGDIASIAPRSGSPSCSATP